MKNINNLRTQHNLGGISRESARRESEKLKGPGSTSSRLGKKPTLVPFVPVWTSRFLRQKRPYFLTRCGSPG